MPRAGAMRDMKMSFTLIRKLYNNGGPSHVRHSALDPAREEGAADSVHTAENEGPQTKGDDWTADHPTVAETRPGHDDLGLIGGL